MTLSDTEAVTNASVGATAGANWKGEERGSGCIHLAQTRSVHRLQCSVSRLHWTRGPCHSPGLRSHPGVLHPPPGAWALPVTPFLSAHHLFPVIRYIQLQKTSDMFRNGPNSTRTLVFPLPGFSSMNTQPLVFYLSPTNSLTLITLKQIPNTTSFHPQTFPDVSVRIL